MTQHVSGSSCSRALIASSVPVSCQIDNPTVITDPIIQLLAVAYSLHSVFKCIRKMKNKNKMMSISSMQTVSD